MRSEISTDQGYIVVGLVLRLVELVSTEMHLN